MAETENQPKTEKTEKEVKNTPKSKKGNDAPMVTASLIVFMLSLLLSNFYPYIKEALGFGSNSVATTDSSIINDFHPLLIISSDDDDTGKKYEFKCTFEENETTKELVKRFPLTVKMIDLNKSEKYATLEESLPVKIEPVEKVNLGDILLYQSQYLAVFYETFDPVKEYSIVGKVDNPENLKEAVGAGSITATFTNKKDN